MTDLTRLPGVGPFLRWRHARTAMQVPLLLLAAVMIWDGLTGPTVAPKNLATVLTWLHYRGFVVLALLVAGNLFCMACPFMLPRNLARRWFQPSRAWPAWLRGKWLATGLFVAFLFAYEAFDLWSSPAATAWLILAYFLGALVVDSLFTGASFCKHVCPIGQFNFTASLLSPLEVKVRDGAVCGSCRTKDCIRGNVERKQPGCELWLFQERKVGNMDCTFCLDCVHACPSDNVGVMTRRIGPDLWSERFRSGIGRFATRPDYALLGAVFTFGALLNAFAMVSPVGIAMNWLSSVTGVRGEIPVLAMLFTVGLVLEPALLLALAGLGSRAAGAPGSLLAVITRFSYSLIPVGIATWLAHYLFHFVTGFWGFVPVVQELAWPALGNPRWQLSGAPAPLWLQPLEYGFLMLGLLISWTAASRLAGPRGTRIALPWQILALVLVLGTLWLLDQPMEMRGTFLTP